MRLGGSRVSDLISELELLVVNGVGRSGTSALTQALGTRPDVANPGIGEAPFLYFFIDFLISYEDLHPHRKYHLACYTLPRDELQALFRSTLFQSGAGVEPPSVNINSKFVVAKTIPDASNITKFREIFPGLRLFYLVRNGIEVVASSVKFFRDPSMDFEHACRNWTREIIAHQPLFRSDFCAVIRHEELIRDPAKVFSAAFERLKLPDDPSPAKFISKRLVNSSFGEQRDSIDVTRVFNSRQSPWALWSGRERTIFVDLCGSTMELLGYSLPSRHS